MTKFTTKTKILALALTTCSVLALGSAAEAETITSTADVTVQNAIGFSETNTLSFGTIVAIGDGTVGGNPATIAMGIGAANASTVSPVGAAADDLIIELIVGDRAEYAITGAAPNTGLNLTIPAGSITLDCGACSGAQPDFSLGTFIANDVAGVVTTDGVGDFTLFVGGTLSTDATAVAPYEDGLYDGDYDVTVAY